MSKYQYGLFKYSELNELQTFLKINFKENHIFVNDTTILEWQHLQNNYLNFIFVRNINSKEILGVMGFIPTFHFDPDLECNKDFWGAIWVVNKESPPGIGLTLIKYFNKVYKPITYASIGISNDAKKIFKLLGQNIGTLSHYYFTNFNITKNIADLIITSSMNYEKSKYVLQELKSLDNIILKHVYKPTKSIKYLINRYKNHPVYNYIFLGIYQQNKLMSIFVTRKQYVNKFSCFNIVDVYGDLSKIGDISSELSNYLSIHEAEYIDCLNYGIDENIFFKLGFIKHNDKNSNILPLYFEPFFKKNVEIDYAIVSDLDNYVIFKADADQDRPNKL